MSRFGKEVDKPEYDGPTGDSFGTDGELDFSVDFYGEAPVSDNLEHISKSRIKTFLKCERKFAMKYLAGQRADQNFYMERGSAVHDAFEKFHQNLEAYIAANKEPPRSFTELMPPAADWFQHLKFIGPFFEWELSRWRAACENTDSFEEALEVWKPHSVEVSLTIDEPPVGSLPWLGPYDCLVDARSVPSVDTNDGLVVIDYKTGSIPDKKEWADEGIHVDLEFYAWMLELEEFDVAAGIGMYPSEDENVVREIPNQDIRDTITEVVEYLHSSSATRSDYPTSPQPLCDWCMFQDQCSTSWNS